MVRPDKSYRFQSLIGRLKTLKLTQSKIFADMVQFQSLIGRLKTFIGIDAMADQEMFQSLIGRLKTRVDMNKKEVLKILFQSLIGRLKTKPSSW